MHELLRALPAGAKVLDLGCGAGSFTFAGAPFVVVRADLEREGLQSGNCVQADAARLPFPASCFDLVIANHSLEHFADLAAALREVGRVLKASGVLFVAVPDATTIADRLYRWLARGGGHVNAFASAAQLASDIEHATGLSHAATRTLCTSFCFMNRKNRRARPPKRLFLVGGGTQLSLLLATYFFRLSDRFLHTRMSVYGWALYFGNVAGRLDRRVWTNVCIRCGSGHPSEGLSQAGVVCRRPLVPTYRCPKCGTTNLFTDDAHYAHLGRG